MGHYRLTARNDMTGEKHGKWTVLEYAGRNPNNDKEKLWRCRCECGTEKVVFQNGLRSGSSFSCGCSRRVTHDPTGKRFGRWLVVKYLGKRSSDRPSRPGQVDLRDVVWCRCDCGTEREVPVQGLRSGTSRSCGCLKIEGVRARSTKHGHASGDKVSSEYKSWRSMLDRCYITSHRSFPRYGGATPPITVCPEWRASFQSFLDHMGPKPTPEHTIDRIDNAKGYEPGNVRWATKKEQAANRREHRRVNTIDFIVNGETMSMTQASRRLKIAQQTLSKWLKRGKILAGQDLSEYA